MGKYYCDYCDIYLYVPFPSFMSPRAAGPGRVLIACSSSANGHPIDRADRYSTHDSMNARKAHNTGRNHISNVRDYFASLGHDTAQSIIDQIIQSHENGGRAAMMAAPSMRLGAGFMNPMAPGMPSFSGFFGFFFLVFDAA